MCVGPSPRLCLESLGSVCKFSKYKSADYAKKLIALCVMLTKLNSSLLKLIQKVTLSKLFIDLLNEVEVYHV